MDPSIKGQLPAKRKEKAGLLKTHGGFLKKQAQNPRAPRAVKQPGAADAYPPSTKALADLDIVSLPEKHRIFTTSIEESHTVIHRRYP